MTIINDMQWVNSTFFRRFSTTFFIFISYLESFYTLDCKLSSTYCITCVRPFDEIGGVSPYFILY